MVSYARSNAIRNASKPVDATQIAPTADNVINPPPVWLSTSLATG